MRIFLSGNAGFIGFHVSRELLKKNYYVVGLDNFSTGKIQNSLDLQEEFEDHFEQHTGSINDTKLVMKLMKDCDKVIHLAAIPRISKSIKYPKNTAMVNIIGTINILKCAAESGIKKLVFSSSSSVYGDSLKPLKEDSFKYPNNPYGLQKWSAEQFCKYYSEKHDLDITILRYFNVYGERQSPDSGAVIPSFIYGILKNDSVKIYNGTQIRSYVYVDDVAYATRLAIESKGFNIFNIAGQRSYTVNDIFTRITREIGRPSEVFYLPMQKSDRKNSIANTNHVNNELGFSPFVIIERGIQNVVDYIRTEYIEEKER